MKAIYHILCGIIGVCALPIAGGIAAAHAQDVSIEQNGEPDCARNLAVHDQYITALRSAGMGAWTQAEQQLEGVIDQCPTHTSARETLAAWYLEEGRADDAQAVLETGGKLKERSASGRVRSAKEWELWAEIELAYSHYERAKEVLEMSNLAGTDELMARIVHAQIASLEPARWTVENLAQANSPAAEHSPLWDGKRDQLIFTSRRGDYPNAPDGMPWEQIFCLRTPQNEGEDPIANLYLGGLASFESAGHVASVAMLKIEGRQQMLIFKGDAHASDGALSLVQSENGSWKSAGELPEAVNSRWPEYGAAFSPDGQTLFFSSERPGGYGGRDLYRINRLPDGSWSRAVILGPEINTAGDEDAPFVAHQGGRLYFASNGHGGMGGYDIFSIDLGPFGDFGRVETVGMPINSPCDDTHYFATENGDVYFTSDRPGGAGRSDIYRAIAKPTIEMEDERQVFTGAFEMPGGAPALVKLVLDAGEGRQKVYRSRTRDGQFVLALDPHQSHRLSVQMNDQEVYSLEISATRLTSHPQRLGRIHLQNLQP